MSHSTDAPAAPHLTFTGKSSSNRALFVSPAPAGRAITAGFSYAQRIGKSANVDVWFPDALTRDIESILAAGRTPGPDSFPAEWAAVRQFELLQEATNYKIYDLDPTRLANALADLTRTMRGGGYRVTVITIGSYVKASRRDELEILDRRLQQRITRLINMLYLEEQSGKINTAFAEALRAERWNYQTALPHVGATLGARDLFRPQRARTRPVAVQDEIGFVPPAPHCIPVIHAASWIEDLGVTEAVTGKKMARVAAGPAAGQYAVTAGVYRFAPADGGKDVLISYRRDAGAEALSAGDRRHRLVRHFFEILGMLPQKHIAHDTAIGLQLPESINENEWIYVAPGGEKLGDFVRLLDDLFTPFNKISLAELHGRDGAAPEIKAAVSHMRGYGDRLNPEADRFYRGLAQYTMH